MSNGWKTERLGSIATLQRGFDLPSRLRTPGQFPIVTSSGIEGTHYEAKVKGSGVVYWAVRHYWESFFCPRRFWPLNTTLYVRDFHGNDPLFISYLLRTIDFDEHSGKTGVPGVNRNDLHEITVRVPATKIEQKAIAAALSDADALIESLERLLAKKRHIKQGAMQELLTGRRRLPGFTGEWEVKRLGDVCVKIQDGTHFSPVLGGNDYLYITSRNIGFGSFDVSSAERISAAEHAKIYARCDVRLGDILLTKDGANTGNAVVNPLEEPFSLLSSVALLRFDSHRHAAAFFLYQILAPDGQQRIKELMSGNAITRLTLKKIREIPFSVASIDEQVAIAAILSDMDTEIAALETQLEKARQVKQGMMQELLTGRVRLV